MIRRLTIALALLIVFVAASGAFVVLQNFASLDEPIALASPVEFEVPRGASYGRVALEMEERGWVDDALWLRVKARFSPELADIQAGYYQFQPGMSALDMLRMMAAGHTHTWPVTFPEGWTFHQMRQELARHEHLSVRLSELSDEDVMAKLGREGMHPEGWFFPDTYSYTKGESDLEILRRAYQRMNRVLAEEWAARSQDLPYDTPYEALIMASIIERETGVVSERREIAGVFVRRLEKGMRLQTDPTVIYGMGDRYEGRITRSDLREETPYNTYRIDGLPPTPIAMPGRGAIHAAVNPADGDALFFVARGDGTHHFSRTLDEHNQAVRRYQLQRREDYRSFPPVEEQPSPDNE